MRILPQSGTVMMRGRAQWLRCAFDGTTLLDDVVTLAAATPEPSAGPAVAPAAWAGLAFDTHCRLFHALPDTAALEYVLWGATSQLGVHDATRHPLVVTGPETEDNGEPLPTADLPLRTEALAVGADDLLYVSDPLRQAVWLIDTWKQEVQRRIDFFHAPLDLAECGGVVFALLADGSTWQLSACEAPARTPWPAITGAQRLSVSQSSTGGRLAWVLTQAGSSQAAPVGLAPRSTQALHRARCARCAQRCG